MRPDLAGPCTLALICASLAAQQGPAASATDLTLPVAAATAPEREVTYDYSADRSRALFQAADDDADDRLDLFETRAAMPDYGDPANTNWFRRLDSNRDGYLDWPEFDRFFRDLVRQGSALRLWHRRPLPELSTPKATGTVPEAAGQRSPLALFDKDHDGALDNAEAAAMLGELGLPPALLGMMAALDTNRDGRFSEQELQPALQRLNLPTLQPGGAAATPAAALPELWAAVDRNGDQSIDAAELGRALRLVDPQLERWAARILAARDRNGDGRITGAELPAAPPAAEARPQAMADRPARR